MYDHIVSYVCTMFMIYMHVYIGRTMHIQHKHRYCGRVHQNQRHRSTTTTINTTTGQHFPHRESTSKSERGRTKRKRPTGPGDHLPSFNQQSGNLEKKRRLRLHNVPNQITPTHTNPTPNPHNHTQSHTIPAPLGSRGK